MKRILLLLFFTLLSFTQISSRDSFAGGFIGGFSGSFIGNAISQPRQSRSECVYQQPVQTRVVEVHKPTYVVQEPRQNYRKKEKRRRRQQEEDILREQRLREIANKRPARERTAFTEPSVEQRMQELACKEKEVEAKKLEAELAKVQAENAQLKLKLQQNEMRESKK